jgi:hypothetical protein
MIDRTMDLEGYELLALTIEGGVQVSKVRLQSTGQPFEIHTFHGAMLTEFDRLHRDLAAVPAHISRVTETSRDATSARIRTEPLPPGVGIRGWAAILRTAPGDSEAERIYRLALQLKMQRPK